MRMLDLEMLRGVPRAAVWLAFGAGATSACGGSSESTDKDESVADTGGADDGSSGGQSGGAGDGVGGADSSGGMGGESSDPMSGGSGSGAASSGGSDGSGGDGVSGGSSGDELTLLGDSCTSPGAFTCAQDDDRLALLCNAEGQWESRETCPEGQRCNFNEGDDRGTCQTPLAECENGAGTLVCDDKDILECLSGGFETTLKESCGEGEGCVDATCQMVADECPSTPINGCSATCDMVPGSCAEEIPCANLGARFNLLESDPEEVVRLPSIRMCDGDGMCGVESLYFPIHVFNPSAETLRVTVGPGWQMTPRYMETDDPSGLDCDARSESCLIVNPLTVPGSRQIVMTPTTDPPIERNALVEIVPEGTTCP